MSHWEFEDLRTEAEYACGHFGVSQEGQAQAMRHLWSREVVERREARFAAQRQWVRGLTRRHTA